MPKNSLKEIENKRRELL